MYYVPDGTKECGYYECKKCGSRFLSLQTMNTIPCPDCGMDIDYEIGPDETLEAAEDTAVLVEKITRQMEIDAELEIKDQEECVEVQEETKNLPCQTAVR